MLLYYTISGMVVKGEAQGFLRAAGVLCEKRALFGSKSFHNPGVPKKTRHRSEGIAVLVAHRSARVPKAGGRHVF